MGQCCAGSSLGDLPCAGPCSGPHAPSPPLQKFRITELSAPEGSACPAMGVPTAQPQQLTLNFSFHVAENKKREGPTPWKELKMAEEQNVALSFALISPLHSA